MITVILPAAGAGTRLNLPYPKELHRIWPEVSLIDYSLAHIRATPEQVERVVTVISPPKQIVADYVARSLPGVPSERAYFNPNYTEWPGSIKSAEHSFGAFNMVLLPDSVLTPRQNDLLVERYLEAFDKGADLVFAYVRETNPERLAPLGAICVSGDRITGFHDKPKAETASNFNAFWASFAFRDKCASPVLDMMMASVARRPVDIAALGLDVRGVEVASYRDLGTWGAISAFLDRREMAAQ